MNFTELKQTWLLNYSENTQRAYEKALDEMVAFVGKPFDAVSRADAERFAAYLREQGVTESTVNLRLAACSSFYEYGMSRYTRMVDGREHGAFDYNPFARVRRAKVQKYGKSAPLEPEQASRLLEQPDRTTERGARDYAMLLFGILTGRRANEICQLRWGDIENGEFYHWRGKGSIERRDTLPAPLWAAIQTYIQLGTRELLSETPVFSSERYPDKPLSTSWFNSMVKQYAAAASLPEWVHAHTLRHTTTALRRRCGADILEISRLLGHADIRTTQVYVNTMTAYDGGWADAWALVQNSRDIPAKIPVWVPEGAAVGGVGNAVGKGVG